MYNEKNARSIRFQFDSKRLWVLYCFVAILLVSVLVWHTLREHRELNYHSPPPLIVHCHCFSFFPSFAFIPISFSFTFTRNSFTHRNLQNTDFIRYACHFDRISNCRCAQLACVCVYANASAIFFSQDARIVLALLCHLPFAALQVLNFFSFSSFIDFFKMKKCFCITLHIIGYWVIYCENLLIETENERNDKRVRPKERMREKNRN